MTLFQILQDSFSTEEFLRITNSIAPVSQDLMICLYVCQDDLISSLSSLCLSATWKPCSLQWRFWRCPCHGSGWCCGAGSMPGLDTSVRHECCQKKKKERKGVLLYCLRPLPVLSLGVACLIDIQHALHQFSEFVYWLPLFHMVGVSLYVLRPIGNLKA